MYHRHRGGNVVAVVRAASPAATPSAGGNQALVGGSDWLVLEVLQPPNPFLLSSADEIATDAGAESDALYAPELQRVMYSFQPPLSDGLDSLSPGVAEMAELDDTESVDGEEEPVEPFSGLLRMVVPVEQFDEMTAGDAGGQSRGRSSGMRRARVWQLREMAVGVSESGLASSLPLPGTMGMPGEEADGIAGVVGQDEVPEVIWLEFRYFDGSAWTSSWDSRSSGRLPVAVEMRFELKQELPEEDAVSSDGETELVDDGLSESGSLNEYMSSDTDMLGTDPMAADAIGREYRSNPIFSLCGLPGRRQERIGGRRHLAAVVGQAFQPARRGAGFPACQDKIVGQETRQTGMSAPRGKREWQTGMSAPR